MTYIIGEIGLNHSGSLATAKKMVEVLKECGADCAKFQLYDTSTLCSHIHQPELYKQFRQCELANWQMTELAEYCKQVGIDFMCTPEGVQEAVFLNNLVDKFKISSVGACNPHLLKLINTFKKPVFISDGLINYKHNANNLLLDCDVTWLKCVSHYPALSTEYPMLYSVDIKGLSDHTTDLDIPMQGSYEVIEKHFTLDKSQDGFDHHMSLNPIEFTEYVRRIRNA